MLKLNMETDKTCCLQIKGYKTSIVECWCDSKALIDDAKWFETKDGYAKSSKYGLMHRYVMGFNKGEQSHRYVDHIDGNRLNNRKSNLRVVTPKQNAKNKSNDPKVEHLHGVIWDVNMQLYATVHKGRMFYWHQDMRMCALCYDSIMFYVYGPGKRLNDNKLQPLEITRWALRKEDLAFLDKIKSRRTDFIGVKWCKEGWKAEIKVDLGVFDSPEAAAKVYDQALCKIKDFPAKEELNFSL